MKDFNNLINSLLKTLGIGMVVIGVWQLLEVIMLGEVKLNDVDTIIAIILTYSLLGNLEIWNKKIKGDK